MKSLQPRARFLCLMCLFQVPLAWWFDDFWFVDATSHFLPQQITLFVITLLIWTMPNGRRLLAAGLAVAMLVSLVLARRLPILDLLLPEKELVLPDRKPDFHLISFNVLTSNTQKEESIDWVRENLAHDSENVVILIEVNDRWVAEASRLRDKLPHQYSLPRSDNFGMMVLSSRPLENAKFTGEDDECGIPRFEGVLEVGSNEAKIVGLHTLPPSPGWLEFRNRCLRIVEEEALVGTQTIVAGDLNCSPWAPCFPRRLNDPSPWFFRDHTWKVLGGLVSTPIDHILHTDGIRMTVPDVGPDLGSDHRPLKTSVWLSP